MGLTEQAIKDRRQGIGGSDAAKIISGEWHDLWLEKTGRKEPTDLSDVFAVQLGIVTETLNLDWFERQEGVKIEHRGLVAICHDHSFLRCTLDGFTHYDGQSTVVQAKHVNPWSTMGQMVEKYSCQVQHEMICTRAPQAVLSVIIGCNEPVRQVIKFDEFWATDYIEKCREFWQHVVDDRAPENGAPMEIAPQIPIDQMRTVDMTGSNAWATYAKDWADNQNAAGLFEAAKKELKKLIPDDVRVASGHGIVATRKENGIFIRSAT